MDIKKSIKKSEIKNLSLGIDPSLSLLEQLKLEQKRALIKWGRKNHGLEAEPEPEIPSIFPDYRAYMLISGMGSLEMREKISNQLVKEREDMKRSRK